MAGGRRPVFGLAVDEPRSKETPAPGTLGAGFSGKTVILCSIYRAKKPFITIMVY